MRKLVTLIAGVIFAVHLTSCTSNDSKDDSAGGDEAVAESPSGTDADLENLDAPPAAEASVAQGDKASEGFLDEQLPEDALGESNKAASNATPSSPAPDLGDSSTPPPMETKSEPTLADNSPPPAATEAPPSDAMASVDTGVSSSLSEPAPMDKAVSSASVAANESDKSATSAGDSKPKASLKKIETAPFPRDGTLMNAVYVVRPKDDYSKISKLIYGKSNQASKLKKFNPAVKTPRPGDKIYYNSPNRPTDDTKLLTYYEDAGMAPEVYIAQEGDDLKKVSKKLLGYDKAWKEIWATNIPIESQGALTAGTELRYWKSAPPPVAPPVEAAPPAPTPDMAINTPPPVESAQPMPEIPPPPPAPTEMAPPAPPVAQNDLPPPPPAEMAPPPTAEVPPPPPAEAVNPPPPPAPVVKKNPTQHADAVEGLDNDMVMTLAGAGILIAGLALVLMIRRRRQNRDMANAFNDTQVGT